MCEILHRRTPESVLDYRPLLLRRGSGLIRTCLGGQAPRPTPDLTSQCHCGLSKKPLTWSPRVVEAGVRCAGMAWCRGDCGALTAHMSASLALLQSDAPRSRW